MSITETDLSKTATGRKMLAQLEREQAAEIAEKRRAAVAELAAIETEWKETIPGLEKAQQAAQKKQDQAIELLKAAEANTRKAWNERRSAVARLDQRRGKEECTLRETAPPAIDQFLHELQQLDEQTRKSPVTRTAGERNLLGRRKPGSSDYPQILDRLQAIQTAMERAEALKLEVVDDIDGAIDEIRQSIP